MPNISPQYKFEYFPRGSNYSGGSDFRRFVTVDYNMESYVGVIGVGVISGWDIQQTFGLEVQILPGEGIINGFYAESPYVIKKRSEMVSGDREVSTIYTGPEPEPDMTTAEETTYIAVIQEYDPSFNPDTPIENAYVKVVVPTTITLPNNTDVYIYARRSYLNFYPPLADYPPNLIPEPSVNDYEDYNDYLVAKAAYDAQMVSIYSYDWRDDSANHFTEATFSFSLTPLQDPLAVLIGKVVTRSGEVDLVDVSQVDSLQDFEATINRYANQVISQHHHGGTENFDPLRINLETDIRDCVLTSYNPETRRGVFSVVESQYSSSIDGHRHTFNIDSDNNGQTVNIIGSSVNHFHKIVDGVMQTQETTGETIADHTHDLPDVSKLVWDDSSEYIVYVNGIPVGDETSDDISVDVAGKRVVLSGIIGSVTKTYGVDFVYEGERYVFSQQQSSVYRFMLNMITDFNSKVTVTDINTNPFIFFDESTQSIAGIQDLKSQSITAEALFKSQGDKFTFTPTAARNIEVTLLAYQKTTGLESDKVTIEILGNSEVTGIVRPENIFFVNASKITSGIFEISQIPFLSHIGRMNESMFSFPYPIISSDGAEFQVTPAITTTTLDHYHSSLVNFSTSGFTELTYISGEPVYYAIDSEDTTHLVAHVHGISNGVVQDATSSGLLAWQNDINGTTNTDSTHTHDLIYPVKGDVKVVYSMSEDRHGNLYAGTSDDLIMIPDEDPYLFVINGYRYYESGTDLLTMFEKAKANYELATGTPLRISSEIYTVQIAIAELLLQSDGDSYLIVGKSETNSDLDQTMIQKLSYIPVPNYYSQENKKLSEVGDNDNIVSVYLINAETGAILDPTSADVQLAISEGDITTEIIARTYRYLDNLPVSSIVVQEVSKNGQINDDILTVGGDTFASNRNIQDNFYISWSSPDTPTNVSILKEISQDPEGNKWIATNNGVLVLRAHNDNSVFSTTTRPGNNPDIQDVLALDSSNVFCASDGIYKTIDQGKTWERKISGNFSQIFLSVHSISVVQNLGHTHVLNVNINGDGILEEENGHTHTVSKWVVAEASGHTHELSSTLYAVTEKVIYKSTDKGENWTKHAEMPSGQNGKVFSFENKLYISKDDGLYKLSSDWVKVSDIIVYSTRYSYDLSSIYLGCSNIIYKTSDGISFSTVFSFNGSPLPALQLNDEREYFGYTYSNRDQRFFLNRLSVSDEEISALVNFDKWYAPNGSWGDSVPYDIYIDNKLILSTKVDVDNRLSRGWSFEVSPSEGLISFSAETTLSGDLSVFDNFIEVADSTLFQTGDRILIAAVEDDEVVPAPSSSDISSANEALAKNNAKRDLYYYATISSTSEGVMTLVNRSTKNIPAGADTKVFKIPRLNGESSVVINIYDSHLSNIGVNTHDELEDILSYTSDQRPYDLNNSYLSNILQLTQAVRYVYPEINSEMIQSIFYDFHYSNNEADDNWVGNYIDLPNSESYSLISYQSPFDAKWATKINKILIGSGTFDGNIIVGTNIGVFWAVLNEDLNTNWFYVWGLRTPIYDMEIFGEENLMVATNDGVYLTQDMVNWEFQTTEAVRFPALSMSLRWPKDNFVIIPEHNATFQNFGTDPEQGLIKSTNGIYDEIQINKSVKIELLDDPTNAKNGSYIVVETFEQGNRFVVTPPFPGDLESVANVKITMGSWWQQFSGEDNLSNSSLTNTLLVGGQNKIAYTPYLQDFLWTSALFETGIDDLNFVNFLPLSTGGILASGISNNQTDVVHQLVKSSDLGKFWKGLYKYEEAQGTVVSSSLSSFGHTVLEVEFSKPANFRYADNEFDKRRISLYGENAIEPLFDGKIVSNDGFNSTITVFGDIANESTISNQNITFRIFPIAINSMVETGKKVLFGTDIGIYEDSETITGEFPFEGTVWSVGNPGRVSKIDKEGVIKSVSVNPSDNTVILSIESSDNISGDEYKDQKLYITDLVQVTDYNITQNSFKNVSGEVTINLSEAFNSIWLSYIGKKVKLVKSQSTIDVDFDFGVSQNQLAGGTLYVSSNENNNIGTKYTIDSNTLNSITLFESLKPRSTLTYDRTNDEISEGQNFIALDSTGRVEVKVTFTNPVVDNYLVDYTFKITTLLAEATGIEMEVYQNGRNSIILNDFSSLLAEDSSGPALIIQENDTFSVSGKIYQPLASFNNKLTSIDSDHYHDIDLVGDFVIGKIDSFVNALTSTVVVEVSNIQLFDSPIVQKDGTLFEGARIRFYNPQNIGVEYFTEVISHTANTITVKLLSSNNWDFTGYKQSQISESWNWEINATSYGYTNNVFYDDFISLSSVVTENIETNDVIVKVDDSTSFLSGDKILIISAANKSEVNFIKTVIDMNTIQIEVESSNSYFVENTVQVKVLRDEFANTHEHMIRNNEVETLAIQDYLDLGYPSKHSHRTTALIGVISDLKEENQNIVVSGSSSLLYNSTNNGASWREFVDLNDFTEGNLEVSGVSTVELRNGRTVAGTANGEIFSTRVEPFQIVPLNQPKVN